MTSFRSRTLTTEVCLLVPTRPAIVPSLEARSRSSRAGAAGELRRELSVGQECRDQLGVDKSKLLGQGAVGCSERRYSLTIMRGSCSKIGDGVDSVLLINSIVGLVVGGASSGATSVTKFAMRLSEIRFKLIPSFVGGDVALPNFTVFDKHSSGVNKLKGIVCDLLGRVGREASSSVVDAIFDLVEKSLDRQVGVVGSLESDIIVLEVGRRDTSVLRVKVVEDLPGRDVEVT